MFKLNALSFPLKQTLIFGLSVALMKGVSLLMLPFITHYLSTYQFGQLELLSSIAILGSVVAGFGLADTLFRFVGLANNSRAEHKHVSQLLILALIISTLFFIVSAYLISLFITDIPGNIASLDLVLVLATITLEGIIGVSLGWLRLQDKAIEFCIFTCGRAILHALLTLIAVSAGMGVTGVLLAGVVASVIQALLLLYRIFPNLQFQFSLRQCKVYLPYCTPIVLSGMVMFCLMGADRWFLGHFEGIEMLAILGVASKFALATVLLMQPYSMWWSPKRFQVLKQQGRDAVAHYISLGIALSLSVGLLMSLLGPSLVEILLPQSYHSAGQYIPYLVLIMVLKENVELVNIGCFNGDSCFSQLWINITSAAIAILLLTFLTPLYSLYGVIAALIIAHAFRLLTFFTVSHHYLPLPYPLINLIVLLLLSSSLFYFFPLDNSHSSIIILASIVCISFSALAFKCLSVDFSPYVKANKHVS